MGIIKIINLLLVCNIASAYRLAGNGVASRKTALNIVMLNENTQFTEQRLIFNLHENHDSNVINPLTVQTQLIGDQIIDDHFVDYQISSMRMAESGVLLAIGKTKQHTYFISRPIVARSGKWQHSIILERWHPILDTLGISLADNDKNTPSTKSCALYIYWIEKSDNMHVYRALYRFYDKSALTNESGPDTDSAVYNIQKYHTFPNGAKDATMMLHPQNHRVFIAVATVDAVMLVKLQSSARPLPPLQHAAQSYKGNCTFQSKLNYFSVHSMILLLKCQKTNTSWPDTISENKYDYMIVDIFSGDTSTSEISLRPNYVTQQSIDYAYFRHHYLALAKGLANKQNSTLSRLLAAFWLDINTSIFLYNNGIGWVIKQEINLPNANKFLLTNNTMRYTRSFDNLKVYPFSLGPGSILMISKYANNIFSHNTLPCKPMAPQQQDEETIASHKKNKTGEYKEKSISKTYINLSYLLVTNERTDEPDLTEDIHSEDIWVPIMIGVLSVVLFVVIIILLFIVRKTIRLN